MVLREEALTPRIWEDATTSKPVAYCWGSLNSHDSVLEVHAEYRGTGVGRAVAEFMIANSLAKRDPLLEIHISPDTAEEFWQRMAVAAQQQADAG